MTQKVKFRCPSCGKKLRVAASKCGKIARCPQCRSKLQIPTTESAPPANGASESADDRMSSESLTVVIVIVALVVSLTFGLAVFWAYSMGRTRAHLEAQKKNEGDGRAARVEQPSPKTPSQSSHDGLADGPAVGPNSRDIKGRLQTVDEHARPSVCLIFTGYAIVSADGTPLWNQGSMGTGFLVSDKGFVVTNKHVAEPWKIDPMAQALSIKGSTQQGAFLSVQRYLWFAGQKFRYGMNDLAFGNAFASTEKQDLYLLSSPVDQWVYQTVGEISANTGTQQAGAAFSQLGLGADDLVRHVELGGDDLAVLWVKATPEALPEPLELGSDSSDLRRLDKVLLLGFPAGVKELEGMSATPTSMLADVRKVQDSIHITTSTAHGNSGGPLLNAKGKVMGVLSKYLSQGNPTSFSCIKVANLRTFAPYLFYEDRDRIVERLIELGAFHPARHTMEVHSTAEKHALQRRLERSYEREMKRFVNYLVFYLSQPVAGGQQYWDRMGFIQSIRQVGMLPLNEDVSEEEDPFTDLLLTPRTSNAWRKLKRLYRSASRSGRLANAELLEPDTALELSRNYFQAMQAMGADNKDAYTRHRDRIGRLYRANSHFFCASHYWGSLLRSESRWDAAIPVLKKTLDLYPRLFRKHQGGIYLTTLNNLGWCYFQKQQFRTAIATYKRVLRECHNDWIALNNIAMCHLYLGNGREAVDYAERATMSGRAKDRAHAYFTLARVYSGGLGNQKQALRCLKRAVNLGLRRPIKQVRASQHLKKLRVKEEFQALTHFDYGFKFEEQWMQHDVHITNRSGFPWTNVTIMLAVDGAKPELRSSARIDPGMRFTLEDVTSTDLEDIRKLELLIYCDQGVWEKRPK